MECNLRDIQKKQYQIFCEFDRICKKHNIRYYMAQGTLLGAVRHKGYIPWDDDIDVIIPFDELSRLMEVFDSEKQLDFRINNHTTEKHYPLTWTKIRADRTLSRPVQYRDIPVHWGICIDLFPIYPVSDNKFVRKLEIFFFKLARKMLIAEMTKYEENHNIVTRLFEKIPYCIRHLAVDVSQGIFALHRARDTQYVYLTCKGGRVMEKAVIEGEAAMLPFEAGEYPAPSDYHRYLTEMFGDYMTPPPPEEQRGHDMRLGEIEWAIYDDFNSDKGEII
ncbi:MAG: LicD family protein [Clostridia bacterium]|nr:LicD family protein [Clostridia bacterium]